MRNEKMCRATALALALSLLLPACGSGALATTMRLRKTEGTVGISDDKNKELEAREDLGLYSGYGVNTKPASYAWVDLDTVKLAKLDQQSSVGIEKEGKNLKLNVESGSVFFQVSEPLKDDESMEIHTSGMAIGIRGTCGWTETSEDGKTSRVYLLEGKVECAAGEKSATVTAGEKATVAQDGEITVEEFSASDIPPFVLSEAKGDQRVAQMIQDMFGPDWASASNGSRRRSEDHVMDWKDPALAEAMARWTGISGREIMRSEVLEKLQNAGGRLDLTSCGISDFSALGELTNLTHLNLSWNIISDIGALEGFESLQELDLDWNDISDVSALGGLTNLGSLSLDSNDISDVSALGGLTNLGWLNLDDNDISDVSALGGLTNLQNLNLGDNDISDVSALGGLTSLRELYLFQNNISDVSALGGLTNLQNLNLDDNNISDVSALYSLPRLWSLGLKFNPVEEYCRFPEEEDLCNLPVELEQMIHR